MHQDKLFVVNDADITSRCRAITKPGLYSILPAANRVMSNLPGFSGIQAQILATPQLGARFTEFELHFQPGGATSERREGFEQFFYVLEGGVQIELEGKLGELEPGSFCWLPPDFPYRLRNDKKSTCRAVWIRRRYVAVEGLEIPEPILSHEANVPAYPTDTYMEKHLTPYEDIRFDMGINLQVFDPGVYFSFVESHIMEHGLYMTEGRGIYWLNGDYIEVQKDDFIFMAPYCPQFFYAMGWDRSAYLLYKDVNRDYVTVDW